LTCAAVSAVSPSQRNGLGLKLLVLVKPSHTVARSFNNIGQIYPTMETCDTSIFPIFEDTSQFSQQASPVSQSPLPGSEKALAMTVGSGRQCSMLLGLSSPVGVFSKILLESSLWTKSQEFIYVWNRSDTKLPRHSLFRLMPLGQSTDESESLLWRTPTGTEANGGAANGEHRLEQGHALRLRDQAKTPKLWPTPTQRDWKNTSHGNQGNARPLSEVAGLTGSGSLNPRFVEELMGFPIDYTAYEL
jgi:hypothetical protein